MSSHGQPVFAALGNPAQAGSLKTVPEGWLLRAGGADIWGTQDEGAFAYERVTGDFDVRVRLHSLGLTHLYAKAGLMARVSLEAESALVYAFAFPDNRSRNHNTGGYEGHVRETAGAVCRAVYPKVYDPAVPAPFPVTYPNAWVRLTRKGDEFQLFFGRDGVVWNLFHAETVRLPSELLVGVAATSHETDTFTEAVFGSWEWDEEPLRGD